MDLSEFAGALRGLADRAESELALACIRPAAREALASLQMETPVRSGALRGSEVIRSVSGSGAFAEAIYGPDIIYDKFRNDGGTIDAKEGLGRKGLRPHTLHWPGGGFPLHVTQHGAHYMEKGEALARENVGTIIQTVLSDFLTL
jgi:hypothetical protein